MAQQPIDGQGQSMDGWPHFHLSAKLKDHPGSSEVTSGQQVESSSTCWHSSPEIPLQTISHKFCTPCMSINPIHWLKIHP